MCPITFPTEAATSTVVRLYSTDVHKIKIEILNISLRKLFCDIGSHICRFYNSVLELVSKADCLPPLHVKIHDVYYTVGRVDNFLFGNNYFSLPYFPAFLRFYQSIYNIQCFTWKLWELNGERVDINQIATRTNRTIFCNEICSTQMLHNIKFCLYHQLYESFRKKNRSV